MTLDLDQVGQQLVGLEQWLSETDASRSARLFRALDILKENSADWEQLATKARMSNSPVLSSLAIPFGPLSDSIPAPLPPQDFSIVAVDGSQIDIDRDNPFPCYLINLGLVTLRYGSQPDALLDNKAVLNYKHEDLFIIDPLNPDRREPIEGSLLNARRNVIETAGLVELVQEEAPDFKTLALIDNSLVLWGLAGNRFDDFVKDSLLNEYKGHLDALQKLGLNRPLAVAGYTSRPGSSSVVNLLRLTHCGEKDCQQCRRDFAPGDQPCNDILDVLDRQVFAEILLAPGDRSSTFKSLSKVVSQYYSDHPVYFFYINTGDEIARVEIPEWVALDNDRLELAHSVLFHQIQAGLGYPVAIMEAHEQAVVSTTDRDLFWQILENALDIQLPFSVMSSKAQSKRFRAL